MTIAKPTSIGRAGQVEASGPLRGIPGYEAGALMGDRPPILLSGNLDVINSGMTSDIVQQWMFPFPVEIVGFQVSFSTKITGTTLVNIGTIGDPNKFAASVSLNSTANPAAALYDMLNSLFVDKLIDAGEEIVLSHDGQGTAGVATYCLIVAPRTV